MLGEVGPLVPTQCQAGLTNWRAQTSMVSFAGCLSYLLIISHCPAHPLPV